MCRLTTSSTRSLMAEIPNTKARGNKVVYQGKELICGMTWNERRHLLVQISTCTRINKKKEEKTDKQAINVKVIRSRPHITGFTDLTIPWKRKRLKEVRWLALRRCICINDPHNLIMTICFDFTRVSLNLWNRPNVSQIRINLWNINYHKK